MGGREAGREGEEAREGEREAGRGRQVSPTYSYTLKTDFLQKKGTFYLHNIVTDLNVSYEGPLRRTQRV